MAKQRVAIVGGGMGGMATAFELSSTPGWQEQLEITVYQSGWLLGGKGASVRNRERHHRVEEHGLHVWMGWYDNAFDLIRRAYQELDRKPDEPLWSWKDAFVPQDFVVLEEPRPEGWAHWRMELPRTAGLPGARPHEELGPRAVATRILTWIEQVFVMWGRQEHEVYVGRRVHARELLRDLSAIRHAWELFASTASLSVDRLARALDGKTRTAAEELAARLTRVSLAAAKVLLPRRDEDLNTRWLRFAIDFGIANAVGLLRDGLYGQTDFSAIDGEDYRAWLRRHGASEETAQAPPVRSVYTLMFSHADGVSAAVAVPTTLRMVLDYERAAFCKMAAGMGETVFAPLYEVLRRRGVRFSFFHQLEAMQLSEDGRDVERLVFAEQATPREGAYDPLVLVDGLPCWPEAPLFEQLVEGDALVSAVPGWAFPGGPRVRERTLHLGHDFDWVVLAVPPPACTEVCAELAAIEPRWRAMLTGLRSVSTQSLQLWMKPELAELGWTLPGPILGTYAAPYDTWCDMTHLLAVERWRNGSAGPRSLGYFCGQIGCAADPPTSTPAAAAAATLEARGAATAWLDAHAGWLFPRAVTEGGAFAWDLAYGDAGREVESQYFRANTAPSERYMLSTPGTGALRLAPHDSGFTNLALAGDWTATGVNGGCIEAAAMSGRQAARAIDRRPRTIPGEPASYGQRFAPSIERPRYVERLFDLQLPQPFHAQRCRMSSFFLRADPRALRRLCDRMLNEPCGGALRYVPAAPLVILACAFVEHMQSAAGGGMREIDIAFWVPLRASGGPRRRSSLAWLTPFVFVDTAIAAAIGRETYGFAKHVADIQRTHDERGLVSLDVTAPALPSLSPEAIVAPHPAIRIRRGASDAPRTDPLLTGAQRALDPLLAPLFARTRAEANLVFLKQFRDIADPSVACYQAIAEAPARVTAYRGTRWTTRSYEIALGTAASLPLVEQLGLAGPTLTPFASAEVDFDFVMERGREVWKAPDR